MGIESRETLPSPNPLTLDGVEQLAKAKLPNNIYDFYACGSDEQKALARNEKAFDRLCIRPRVLRDVSDVDTSTSILGHRTSLPIGIAPSAMQKLAGGDGELDVARAAVNMRLNLTLSSQSTTSLEDVAQIRSGTEDAGVGTPPFWMQIYLYEDVHKSVNLIRRAEAAGYQALVLTVDTPVLGNRLAERRTAVTLPPGMELPNLERKPRSSETQPSINRLLMNAKSANEAKSLRAAAGSTMHSSSLTWEQTIGFLRSVTKMKIILKGIMTAEDASLSVEHGVDAIIVSNHGGRQLDAASSTIEALPEIAAAVQKKDYNHSGWWYFVLIGRPALWGLAYNGHDGVEAVMNIMERELSRTMALAGVKSVEEITKDKLGVVPPDGFGIARL
ncbi:S-2-hydroxy-acid oxidase [Aspergillus steynii IBT 23096]|uniref:S-2-hydroxy-acid oxidase n=1 Tax=Aspergillus steynii IBT 23096 TaxID=1392250 RepID=A0A2I2GF58_9EURO|nr:S-2-hydroxy-acid oxidase [Aspergillus steynii IBT 23096]PLB51467.1 S-2-hydroxy-acid oxidase [Aspergillus steynii IBT 23096]